MILLLKDFLLKPKIKPSFKKLTLNDFLTLFLIDFIIVTTFLVLMELFFLSRDNSFSKKFEEVNEDIILYAVLGVIFFPILEEFLHRYYLDYRIKSLLISTLLLLLYFFASFDDQNSIQNAIHFLCFLFLFIILLLKKIYGYINISLLVWGSILFFGLFHLSTYESDLYAHNFLMIPLLVMPQFIGGFFLAFIRTHYRFIHCILYHGFTNLVIFIVGYIVYKLFPL